MVTTLLFSLLLVWVNCLILISILPICWLLPWLPVSKHNTSHTLNNSLLLKSSQYPSLLPILGRQASNLLIIIQTCVLRALMSTISLAYHILWLSYHGNIVTNFCLFLRITSIHKTKYQKVEIKLARVASTLLSHGSTSYICIFSLPRIHLSLFKL